MIQIQIEKVMRSAHTEVGRLRKYGKHKSYDPQLCGSNQIEALAKALTDEINDALREIQLELRGGAVAKSATFEDKKEHNTTTD
jgi:hypothetical protein